MTTLPGSYTETSRNVVFTPNSSGGGVLTAECRRINGSWAPSQLTYDIANNDGTLTALPSGSYQKTARNIRFAQEGGAIYLVAECQRINGQWTESRLKYDIANIDGVLTWKP